MCEPTHSIVQFPTKDQDGDDISSKFDGGASGGGGIARRLGSVLKKIGDWLHLSKMGRGHSESFESAGIPRFTLPDPIQYEAHWWDRTLKVDHLPVKYGIGIRPYTGLGDFELQTLKDAQECAGIYADKVSIGSLTSLRQFLTKSFQTTDREALYLEAFRDMLNGKGRGVLDQKLKYVELPEYSSKWLRTSSAQKQNWNKVLKIILGLTRKRELLVPVWADDDKLWVPNTP